MDARSAFANKLRLCDRVDVSYPGVVTHIASADPITRALRQRGGSQSARLIVRARATPYGVARA
eukprot:11168023-Lingulodinium_polyedra.AAC.1